MTDAVDHHVDDTYAAAFLKAQRGQPLTPADMMAIYGITRNAFWSHRHEYDRFKLNPAIGRACYSGVLVYRHLTGQPLYEPTFGRASTRGRS
jgi:hypothetical protein